jgi:hypothetical protein
MAFCSSSRWQMSFFRDSAPSSIERGVFNLTIVNGEITGDFFNSSSVRISKLRGSCEPIALPGLPETSRMTFAFRFRRGGRELGVMMAGFAFTGSDTRTEFIGRFRVFDLDPDLPTAGTGELQTIQTFDTGETGTGSGQQT